MEVIGECAIGSERKKINWQHVFIRNRIVMKTPRKKKNRSGPLLFLRREPVAIAYVAPAEGVVPPEGYEQAKDWLVEMYEMYGKGSD